MHIVVIEDNLKVQIHCTKIEMIGAMFKKGNKESFCVCLKGFKSLGFLEMSQASKVSFCYQQWY